MKLQEILTGQDFGQKEMDKIANKVLNDEPQTINFIPKLDTNYYENL